MNENKSWVKRYLDANLDEDWMKQWGGKMLRLAEERAISAERSLLEHDRVKTG